MLRCILFSLFSFILFLIIPIGFAESTNLPSFNLLDYKHESREEAQYNAEKFAELCNYRLICIESVLKRDNPSAAQSQELNIIRYEINTRRYLIFWDIYWVLLNVDGDKVTKITANRGTR